MRRREFLGEVGAMAGGIGALARSPQRPRRPQRVVPQYYDLRKLIRVGVSSWSFHNCFPATRSLTSTPLFGTLALLDFPRIIADRYQVHNLEFVAPHFASTDPAYLAQLLRALFRARSRLINLPADIPELRAGGGLSDPSSIRQDAIAAVKNWIDIARDLRARSVRADPGQINPANLAPTIDSYRQLAAYGRRRGIDVLIENRQGPEAQEIVAILRGAASRSLGALPDFGNISSQTARPAGLRLLFPCALTVCHAKGISFDADGNETTFNFPACIEIAKQARFGGIYSIQYEGSADPYSGVQNVINELMRYL
ncbi:MAG: sugar phosphate isomerase/epimerase family protein [Terriglobia bacterium]